MRYVAIIRKTRGSDYGVEFPDFPGCVSAGRSVEEAAENAAEALNLHVQGLREDQEAMPEPTPAEGVLVEPAEKGERYCLVFVEPPLPSRTVRVNVTMDERLLRAADAEAGRRGTTRSGLISELVREATRRSPPSRP